MADRALSCLALLLPTAEFTGRAHWCKLSQFSAKCSVLPGSDQAERVFSRLLFCRQMIDQTPGSQPCSPSAILFAGSDLAGHLELVLSLRWKQGCGWKYCEITCELTWPPGTCLRVWVSLGVPRHTEAVHCGAWHIVISPSRLGLWCFWPNYSLITCTMSNSFRMYC